MNEFRRLSRLVSEVLWRDWDPIGVNASPEARSEYEDYVPLVVGTLLRGASERELAEILAEISADRMGLRDEDAANRAAGRLVAIKKKPGSDSLPG